MSDPKAADDEPQNVYDDPRFFDGYSRLERYTRPFGDAYEHPAFLELLPPVAGVRALDLGCGAGHLTLQLAEAGAAEVIGVDLSERMLADARRLRSHPNVVYRREAMDDLDFPPDRFELVTSSLAFHYVADYADLLRRIGRWLLPGGHLVFSIEHPIILARAAEDGWIRDESGAPLRWTIDHYAEEGRREEHWFREGVRKYHRTVASLVNGVIGSGLVVERLVEPWPSDEQLDAHPEWIHERKRPVFLLVRAVKPAAAVG